MSNTCHSVSGVGFKLILSTGRGFLLQLYFFLFIWSHPVEILETLDLPRRWPIAVQVDASASIPPVDQRVVNSGAQQVACTYGNTGHVGVYRCAQ